MIDFSKRFTREDFERTHFSLSTGNFIPTVQLDSGSWQTFSKCWLDPLEDYLRANSNSPAKKGTLLKITSGYRSPELNRAIGGSENSQHLGLWRKDFFSCAVDLQWTDKDNGSLINAREIAIAITGLLRYDQCILEYNRINYWIHLSALPFNLTAQRNQYSEKI